MDKEPLLFVGKDLEFVTGPEAAMLLQTTNDSAYIDQVRGVVRVSRERWNSAQKYEHNTWMVAGQEANDDRNEYHASRFDRYKNLEGASFDSAIELGCGPFTNLRVIARHCQVARCTLLDPLINEYLKHKNCAYSNGILKISNSLVSEALEKNRARRAIRRLLRATFPQLLVRGIPIERLINAPIEDIGIIGQYDMVVMINVIEHCFDVERIFASIIKLCRKGTVFVFHDRLYSAFKVKRRAMQRFDAGHPLRVEEEVILNFLETHFCRVYVRRSVVEDEYAGIDLTENGIYFIGRRK
jgi:SAM-dependent methyltransferase